MTSPRRPVGGSPARRGSRDRSRTPASKRGRLVPDVDRRALTFKRAGKYHLASACKQYTVSASSVAGDWKYTAWLRGKPSEILGIYEKSDQAIAACEERERCESTS